MDMEISVQYVGRDQCGIFQRKQGRSWSDSYGGFR